MLKKYFTIEEARKILEDVKKHMKRILELKSALDIINSVNIEYSEDYTGDFDEINFTKVNKEFHKLSYEFFSRIEDLELKGCIIKDINEGLVDFSSIINGKEILLCWKYGEEQLEYWHDLDDGFSGRQPINRLLNSNKNQI